MRRSSSAISMLVHHAIVLERKEREIAGLLCWNRKKSQQPVNSVLFWIFFQFFFFPLRNYHVFASQLLTLVVWYITTIKMFAEHHAGVEHLKNTCETCVWFWWYWLVLTQEQDLSFAKVWECWIPYLLLYFSSNVNKRSQSWGIVYRYINRM